MSTELLKKCKEDFPLLVEAGFVAVNQADEQSAHHLFQIAKTLNPESTAPLIGLGYIHMHKLEMPEAIKFLSEALEKEPDNEIVKGLIGFCHVMTEKEKEMQVGQELLQDVASNTQDEDLKNLSTASRHVVEFISDNHVSAPFDLKN